MSDLLLLCTVYYCMLVPLAVATWNGDLGGSVVRWWSEADDVLSERTYFEIVACVSPEGEGVECAACSHGWIGWCSVDGG